MTVCGPASPLGGLHDQGQGSPLLDITACVVTNLSACLSVEKTFFLMPEPQGSPGSHSPTAQFDEIFLMLYWDTAQQDQRNSTPRIIAVIMAVHGSLVDEGLSLHPPGRAV